MRNDKSKLVHFRHRIARAFFWIPIQIYVRLAFGFKTKKYKIKKDENVLILSNHQTDFDPILIFLTFNQPLYVVATDTLMSNGFVSKFLHYCFSPIPKKKGKTDIKTIVNMMKIAKEGGSLLLFPEGNRTYAEFQFDIGDAIVSLVRKLHLPLLLYNLHGGTGVMPRFFDKPRKGPFYGEVVRRINPDEYEAMDDATLLDLIKDTLRVYDSDSKLCYRGKNRAQYLENMLFVCPKCSSISSLVSKGNHVHCKHCGLTVEYTEDLHLRSDDSSFAFTRLIDWYNFQKDWVKNTHFDSSTIFQDDDVQLFELNLYQKRKLIAKDMLTINATSLQCGNFQFPISEITVASPIGGRKLAISCGEKNYLILSGKRFNPLKYALLLNKLDSGIKRIGHDKNFSL